MFGASSLIFAIVARMILSVLKPSLGKRTALVSPRACASRRASSRSARIALGSLRVKTLMICATCLSNETRGGNFHPAPRARHAMVAHDSDAGEKFPREPAAALG